MDSLIEVASFLNHIDAELARSALEAAGIESMTRSDDVGGLRPHMAFGSGVAVLVRAEDEVAAREILGESAR